MCEVSEVWDQYCGQRRIFSSTCNSRFDKFLNSEFTPNKCLPSCLLKQTTKNSLQITFTLVNFFDYDQEYRDLKAFLSTGRIPAGYSGQRLWISNAARSQ